MVKLSIQTCEPVHKRVQLPTRQHESFQLKWHQVGLDKLTGSHDKDACAVVRLLAEDRDGGVTMSTTDLLMAIM